MEQQLRILLFEEDLADAEVIKRSLSDGGFSFEWSHATDHHEFVSALTSFAPDVILCDFFFPALDGWTALGSARTLCPDTPFIFISDAPGQGPATEALKKMATAYVQKGRPADLVSSIKQALREASERAEHRKMQERLRTSEEFFRLICENIGDLVSVLDAQGKRIYNSPSYLEIMGDPNMLAGTDSFEEIHPEDRDRVRDIFLETVRTGVGRTTEYRFIDIEGKIHQIESVGSVVKDAAGKASGVIVVSRDVTKRKETEKEKEELQAQLRQAQKMESIGTLAGGIAHDFNNILGIILGYATLLKGNPVDQKKLDEALESVIKATERGAGLVRQLMTFARKSEIVFEPVNVNSIVEELKTMLAATFPKTIAFTLKLAPDLPLVTADAAQIDQMLMNLCVNARDAMPSGGMLSIITENVHAAALAGRSAPARSDRYVAVHVADTGVGMDEETRKRIFEPFFTTKEHGKGTGLGLATVYGIVRGHNGFVEVDSRPGEGTTFHIYLPVENEQPNVPKARQGASVPVPTGTETILVVEDEGMFVNLVTSLLTTHGYHVLVAGTGREAVEVYRNHAKEIALVVSDIGLPELDGKNAYLRMREVNPQVRVIFVTGYLDEREKTDLLQMGAYAVLRKPCAPEELLRTIRAAIDEHTGK